MTMVIDVDSHFEPGDDWLEPDPKLAARLPKLEPARLAVDTIVGDLLHDVPEKDRPPLEALFPPGLLTLFGQEKENEAERRAEFAGKNQFQVANAQARMKWIDAQGIDIQNVICLSGIAYTRFIDDLALRQETLRTANTWLAETCAPSGGRLLPVTALDYTDIGWAVDELTRMRGHGSRIFLIPAYPVNGVPPIHPRWDRLWSAATDLGMAPMLHTGFEHMRFDPGWANTGGDVTLLRQIGGSHRHVAPMTLLNAMVYSGTFEKHPTLTVLLAEVGVGWLPFLHREIDDRISPTAQLFLGKWSLPLKPSDYLARNVRATPLNGGNDQPLPRIIEELPDDMVLFSSDFPHFEGFSDPAAYFSEALAPLSQPKRDRFFGGAAAEIFKRMGDPIC